MAQIISLPSISNTSGTLSVFEHVFMGSVGKLEFLINKSTLSTKIDTIIKEETDSGLICLNGSCKISIDHKFVYTLSRPSECLIINPNEAFNILFFSFDCILILLKKAHKN
jgi:WxcM-like, C-terminal